MKESVDTILIILLAFLTPTTNKMVVTIVTIAVMMTEKLRINIELYR